MPSGAKLTITQIDFPGPFVNQPADQWRSLLVLEVEVLHQPRHLEEPRVEQRLPDQIYQRSHPGRSLEHPNLGPDLIALGSL